MATGFPYFHAEAAEEGERLRGMWILLLVWGVLLTALGVAAISYPAMATVKSVEIFGVLLMLGGAGQFAGAFFARGWGGLMMSLLCGCLYIFAGMVLFEKPLLGAAGYTLLLAMMFFASGVAKVASSLIVRFTGWGWKLLSGIVSIALGMMIWRDMPAAAFWVIGTYVGLEMIFAGLGWIMIALAVRQLGEGREAT